MNARVEKDQKSWKGIIGPRDVGNQNSNGLLLLSKRFEPSCALPIIYFGKLTSTKHLYSPEIQAMAHIRLHHHQVERCPGHLHHASYERCKGLDRPQIVRAVVNVCTDPTHWKRPKVIKVSFNMARLKHTYIHNKFQEALDEKLKAIPLAVDSTAKWLQFKNIGNETAKATLGLKNN